MFDLDLYGAGLAVALAIAVAGWAVSIPQRDVSLIDSLWPLFFLALIVVYVTLAPALGERALLLLFMVTLWAVRLALFITLRHRGAPEDHRYQRLRADHEPGFRFKSLYMVFGLQAILAWILSLPLLGAALGPAPLGWLDSIAVGLWLTGFAFEAVGDHQIAAFKAAPASAGRVLDRGLWRGLYLLALAAGAWWSLVSPLLMTALLLRVSGVPLLESEISGRRPAYRDYQRRTNALFPGPRRRASAQRR
jgi:steroid 5-alpha reductase family enzyme